MVTSWGERVRGSASSYRGESILTGNLLLPWKVHPAPGSSSYLWSRSVLIVSPRFPAKGLRFAMFPIPGELASSEVAKDNLVLGVDF